MDSHKLQRAFSEAVMAIVHLRDVLEPWHEEFRPLFPTSPSDMSTSELLRIAQAILKLKGEAE